MFEPDTTLQRGGRAWKVDGLLEVPRTVFDNELWANLPVLQHMVLT